jgi:hypothetical protein
VLTDEREEMERNHSYKDSCGVADHVNEYDEKLNNSIIEEEDQRSILIIGGIQIFLPNIQVESNAHDESAPTIGKIQLVVIFIKKEEE